jgi:hypothetical protein
MLTRPVALRFALAILPLLLCACSGSAGETGAGGSGVGGSGNSSAGGTGGAGGHPHGGSAGSGGTGGSVSGDRYVAPNGTDNGDCSVSDCLTFGYAGQQMQPGEVLVARDGSYPDAIDATTFPPGTAADVTVVAAEHDGGATVTGAFDLYANADFFLEFDGLRFEGPDTKGVAGGHVTFRRTTFVGGPPAGNVVSWGVGTNDFQPGAWDILCEDCLFYGLGGRYAAMAYRAERVVLRRAVARKDGGWGLGGSGETEFEPEGGIMFYETSSSSCEQCVVLDSLKLSDPSAEALGALIQNSHDLSLHTDVSFSECVVVGNDYSGITFEGNGSVGNATVTDSHSAANTGNGITANVAGSIALTRIKSNGNAGVGVANYGSATMTLSDSIVSGNTGGALDGVSGATNGAGPAAIDLSAFDDARLRQELCVAAGVSRGYCAASGSFQDYLGGLL